MEIADLNKRLGESQAMSTRHEEKVRREGERDHVGREEGEKRGRDARGYGSGFGFGLGRVKRDEQLAKKRETGTSTDSRRAGTNHWYTHFSKHVLSLTVLWFCLCL